MCMLGVSILTYILYMYMYMYVVYNMLVIYYTRLYFHTQLNLSSMCVITLPTPSLRLSRHCRAPPGTCEPHVETVPITPHCKYIMLMTDGVYGSIEAGFEEKARIDGNKVLMSIINREKDNLTSQKRPFDILADRVVDRIRAIHEDSYKMNATKDVRSPVAIACRKRDDMTLLVHQFERGHVSFV